ncbi:hypothetical protein LOC68_03950 [Blastopirellula sp. JC732]|uniref:DNA ligase D 3'-phosphoesterase domain-containing protein n=1 Tax=Blastopirellula sediminis TaxID=2894196 RepID=A0A9X1SFI2_9BACT|nr:DNA polymerase ligase N-terminal domain-containing protein [Blastopirellula sediminis]MCC9609688.1 hypothetical protein [Blastopirellula sediminis]MCC9627536.1 hypothetical protein [Blastopirellula sediminis]
MKRFVLLYHQFPADHDDVSHYDLMLEEGDALRTWRLLEKPDMLQPVRGEAIFPHRLTYLDYEGEVSGNRGSVTRIDRGEYELVRDDAETLIVQLYGSVLIGRLAVLIS